MTFFIKRKLIKEIERKESYLNEYYKEIVTQNLAEGSCYHLWVEGVKADIKTLKLLLNALN